jgi:hypothetical protein
LERVGNTETRDARRQNGGDLSKGRITLCRHIVRMQRVAQVELQGHTVIVRQRKTLGRGKAE